MPPSTCSVEGRLEPVSVDVTQRQAPGGGRLTVGAIGVQLGHGWFTIPPTLCLARDREREAVRRGVPLQSADPADDLGLRGGGAG